MSAASCVVVDGVTVGVAGVGVVYLNCVGMGIRGVVGIGVVCVLVG